MGAPNFLLLAVTICLMLTAVNGLTQSQFQDIKGKLMHLYQTKSEQRGFFLPANVLRAAFHELGTYSVTQRDGGASGLIFKNCDSRGSNAARHCERANRDNNGLDAARTSLLKLWEDHNLSDVISLADFLQLAAITAIEFTGGPKVEEFDFTWGREDKEVSESKAGRLPKANLGLRQVLGVFAKQGLTSQQSLALMGAHTIGECHKGASGHNGPWTFTPRKWNNHYYKSLMSSNWVHDKGSDDWKRSVVHQGKVHKSIMLKADFVLWEEGSESMKQHIRRYATDSEAWNKDFVSAWKHLMNPSFGTPDDVLKPLE